MCAILGTPLHILNIHGGMEDQDIIGWMSQKIVIANRMTDPTERIVVFLDEINTCNCMGLFKEIVCDRSLNGQLLPQNIKIIAACNPYRLRTTKSLYGGEEMAGLAFEHFCKSTLENVGTGIKDPLRNLVYRVHPLPEAMIDHVFDFGSLSADTESLYIKAMLRKQFGAYCSDEIEPTLIPTDIYRGGFISSHFNSLSPFDEFVSIFSELICEAQECLRKLSDGERSATSLRDVSRCLQIFIWFGEYLAKTVGLQEGWNLFDFFNIKPKAHKYIRKALILSLAYCYHARLPREERRILVNTITNKWRSFQILMNNPMYSHRNTFGLGTSPSYLGPRAKCRWLNLDFSSFISVLEETQREFVSMMNLGEGIALNEALCENLFMILCSVLNHIPIFVIGKPGSSKSLAMGLIQSNLNGDASENEFLRSLPAVEVFSYQCSPLSTSLGIEQAFESARRYKREASNTVVVILLDEVPCPTNLTCLKSL
jgi:E3 ubiquitin-protein ligase RNF213